MLSNQLLLQMRRSSSVVTELHAELSLTLGGGSQLRAEAKHGIEGTVTDESEVFSANFSIVNRSIALVHQHQDVSLELVGGSDGGSHEGLENLTTGISECLLESHLGGEVEGVIGRIGNVSSTIVDNHLGANDAVAEQWTLIGGGIETLGASRQELIGNVTTDDLRLVVVVGSIIIGLDETSNTGEVTRTTGLTLEEEIEVGVAGNSFTVSDTGLASDTVGLVLTAETLNIDFEVQFTHARNNGLFTLGVDVDTERRVFALEAVHGLTEVVGITGALRLDGQRHDGIGDEHGRHGVGETTVSEGITRGTVDTENGADLSGTNLVDIFHLVGVHADDTGNADLFVSAGVEQVGALGKGTLVDTDVGKLTVVVLFKLESQTDKGERVVGDELDSLLISDLVESSVFNLARIGEVVANSIEHGLDSLIGESRTHHDRRELAGNSGAANSTLDLFVGRLLLVEEELSHFVVDISKLLNEDLALLFGETLQVSGQLVGSADLEATSSFKVHGLHLDQVNNTLELVFGTDGDLNSSRGNLELGVDLLNSLPRVGAHTVHLVDEGDSGDIVTLHLTIDGNGLRLNTANGAQNHDGTIENSEGTLDFNREINMAGGIDQVDMVGLVLAVDVLLPVAESSGRLNGNSLFTLQVHRVHLGPYGVFASNFVDRLDSSGVEKNSFGNGGFATINMGLKYVKNAIMVLYLFHKLTAIPMFRTRDSRLASSGDMLAATNSGVKLAASSCAFLSLFLV